MVLGPLFEADGDFWGLGDGVLALVLGDFLPGDGVFARDAVCLGEALFEELFEPLEWFLQVEEPKKIRGKNWIESLQKFQRFYSPKKICFMHYHKTNGGCSS